MPAAARHRRDHPDQWLRAGEALERVWLEIAPHGFVMSPLTQIAEVPAVRAALRTELRMSTYPHILMRVGRAAPTAGVPRRHLDEQLTDPIEPARAANDVTICDAHAAILG